MSENGQKPQCEAVTQSGARCRLPARAGSGYCHRHQAWAEPAPDAAPAPRDAGREEEAAPVSMVAAPAQPAAPVEAEIASHRRDRSSSTAGQALRIARANVERLLGQGQLSRVQALAESEWLDADTWRGIGYVLQMTLETQADFVKRRLRGEYEVDNWGYDPEVAEYVALAAGFFFKKYWRAEITGVERIPNEGRVLLVSNHSGVLPLDGAMIAYGVRERHPAHRLVRALVANWFPTLPFFSMLLHKTGQVLAHPENGRRLLEGDEAVLVFPEGYKGVGKLFRDRYKLARFGRGGFVKMALETKAPIFPVSVVGAEETYPMIANVKPIARMLGFPFFPITPTWPWLGVLGLLPLPSKWTIDIGEPIDVASYEADLANNPAYVSDLADLIRNRIQEQIDYRLAHRRSVIFG